MFKFDGAFFDSAKVIRAMNTADRRAQGKAGGYVRRVAKNSIKYKDGPSAPGRPPHAHRYLDFTRKSKSKGVTVRQPASPLRELIFYGYDTQRKSTVIGPALFRGSKSPGIAPKRLEKGGGGIRPRPFMVPAMKIGAKKYPDFLRGGVSGGSIQ